MKKHQAGGKPLKDTIAIILAAGLGTRMKSSLPKGLFRVAGLPLVCYPIKAALEAGVSHVTVVVGHQAELVKAEVTKYFPTAQIDFAMQEQQLGTAHATLCAAENAAPFKKALLMNGDLPLISANTIKALGEVYDQTGTTFALVTSRVADPGGFGRIERSPDGEVQQIVEKRDATQEQLAINEVNVGLYMAETASLYADLAKVGTSNQAAEFYFTDIVKMRTSKGEKVGAYVLGDASEAGQINNRVELSEVEAQILRSNAAMIMNLGVTIHLPETVYIETGCLVGSNSEIEPGVSIKAGTVIGSNCLISRGSVLTNARIGDGVTIKPYCVITDSEIKDFAIIGPFAHLRPQSVVGNHGHVGNFVEMKKSNLGEGSKVNHLSYIGDAQVGEKVNIGAGTITCNYDGINKNITVIESGAFIGSDTQLVAPVKVGKNSYVGAGTTVTEDVPDGALALSRVKQVNIENYAKKK